MVELLGRGSLRALRDKGAPSCYKRRVRISLLACFAFVACASGPPVRPIVLAPDVEVRRIADGVWMHTTWSDAARSIDANGLVVETMEGAIIVDATWNDAEMSRLIDWVSSTLHRNVTDLVITHAHRDRDGGMEAAVARGVKVHAGAATEKAISQKGRPWVGETFEPPATLRLGDGAVEIYYPGPGHTLDNVVVWVPRVGVLHGGCFVKSYAADDLGNVADADLVAWPASLRNVVARYPGARIVIPGHGPVGGREAIVHTIELLGRRKSPAAR